MIKPIYPHTVITGDFDWNKINSLPDDCWYAEANDALAEGNAERIGEEFDCGDGELRLTKVVIDAETRVQEFGYLVEVLNRN